MTRSPYGEGAEVAAILQRGPQVSIANSSVGELYKHVYIACSNLNLAIAFRLKYFL